MTPHIRKALPALMIMLYGVASLAHFVHNAEFLADYPNLPVWLTRGQVYVAWFGITGVGVLGRVIGSHRDLRAIERAPWISRRKAWQAR